MKKFLFLLIAFITVLSFSSCEKKEEVSPDNNPVTASGGSVTPMNDTIRFYTGSRGNPGSSWTLTNDGIIRTDISSMTISPNNNFCKAVSVLYDYNGDGTRTYVGKVNATQPDYGEPGAGTVFTEYFTINYTLTSGYAYSTTLVITQE